MLNTVRVEPIKTAARVVLNLHPEQKDGDHNAWLCRVFDRDDRFVSFGTGETMSAALRDAMRAHECLVDRPA